MCALRPVANNFSPAMVRCSPSFNTSLSCGREVHLCLWWPDGRWGRTPRSYISFRPCDVLLLLRFQRMIGRGPPDLYDKLQCWKLDCYVILRRWSGVMRNRLGCDFTPVLWRSLFSLPYGVLIERRCSKFGAHPLPFAAAQLT